MTVFDARPAAWEITGRVASDPAIQAELRDWLAGELDHAQAVVVKDPRIGWFVPLWTGCSDDLGVPHSHLMMLRHPAEILASARRWYGDWQTDASRAAAWLNVMLETERSTRGGAARVRPLRGPADRLARRGRSDRRDAGPAAPARASTASGSPRWASSWTRHCAAAASGGKSSTCRRRCGTWPRTSGAACNSSRRRAASRQDVHAALDAARSAYVSLYRDAEAIAQSSVTAVKPRKAPRTSCARARHAARAPRAPVAGALPAAAAPRRHLAAPLELGATRRRHRTSALESLRCR